MVMEPILSNIKVEGNSDSQIKYVISSDENVQDIQSAIFMVKTELDISIDDTCTDDTCTLTSKNENEKLNVYTSVTPSVGPCEHNNHRKDSECNECQVADELEPFITRKPFEPNVIIKEELEKSSIDTSYANAREDNNQELNLYEADTTSVWDCDMCGHNNPGNENECCVCRITDELKPLIARKTYTCDHCSTECLTKLTLTQHLNECIMSRAKFHCKLCGPSVKFLEPSKFQFHLNLIHHDEINVCCSLCETQKKFSTVRCLITHVYMFHDGLDDLLLEQIPLTTRNTELRGCSRRLKLQKKVKVKRRRRYNKQTDCGLCHVCGKLFKRNSSLSQHIKLSHQHYRPKKCNMCGKSFRLTIQLNSHIESIHENHEKYPCTLCSTLLSTKVTFQKHMQRHKNADKKVELKFKCPVCPKMFLHKKYVERHLRSHTGETPFKCSHCEREFTTEWNRVQHERLHTGEKRYKCEECGKGFTHNVSKKNHMKYHKD